MVQPGSSHQQPRDSSTTSQPPASSDSEEDLSVTSQPPTSSGSEDDMVTSQPPPASSDSEEDSSVAFLSSQPRVSFSDDNSSVTSSASHLTESSEEQDSDSSRQGQYDISGIRRVDRREPKKSLIFSRIATAVKFKRPQWRKEKYGPHQHIVDRIRSFRTCSTKDGFIFQPLNQQMLERYLQKGELLITDDDHFSDSQSSDDEEHDDNCLWRNADAFPQFKEDVYQVNLLLRHFHNLPIHTSDQQGKATLLHWLNKVLGVPLEYIEVSPRQNEGRGNKFQGDARLYNPDGQCLRVEVKISTVRFHESGPQWQFGKINPKNFDVFVGFCVCTTATRHERTPELEHFAKDESALPEFGVPDYVNFSADQLGPPDLKTSFSNHPQKYLRWIQPSEDNRTISDDNFDLSSSNTGDDNSERKTKLKSCYVPCLPDENTAGMKLERFHRFLDPSVILDLDGNSGFFRGLKAYEFWKKKYESANPILCGDGSSDWFSPYNSPNTCIPSGQLYPRRQTGRWTSHYTPRQQTLQRTSQRAPRIPRQARRRTQSPQHSVDSPPPSTVTPPASPPSISPAEYKRRSAEHLIPDFSGIEWGMPNVATNTCPLDSLLIALYIPHRLRSNDLDPLYRELGNNDSFLKRTFDLLAQDDGDEARRICIHEKLNFPPDSVADITGDISDLLDHYFEESTYHLVRTHPFQCVHGEQCLCEVQAQHQPQAELWNKPFNTTEATVTNSAQLDVKSILENQFGPEILTGCPNNPPNEEVCAGPRIKHETEIVNWPRIFVFETGNVSAHLCDMNQIPKSIRFRKHRLNLQSCILFGSGHFTAVIPIRNGNWLYYDGIIHPRLQIFKRSESKKIMHGRGVRALFYEVVLCSENDTTSAEEAEEDERERASNPFY